MMAAERNPLLPQDAAAEEEEAILPRRGALFTLRLAFYSTASYLCFFGLRKPWVVLVYQDAPPILGVRPKIAIAAAQTVSYFCGKTFGVGLVSRVPQSKLRRALSLAGGCAGLAWLGFATLPCGVLTLAATAFGGFPLALAWQRMDVAQI